MKVCAASLVIAHNEIPLHSIAHNEGPTQHGKDEKLAVPRASEGVEN